MYGRFAANFSSAGGIGNHINKMRRLGAGRIMYSTALMVNHIKFGIKTTPNSAAIKDLPRFLTGSFPRLPTFDPRVLRDLLCQQVSSRLALNRNCATLTHNKPSPACKWDYGDIDGGAVFPTGFISSQFANSEDGACVLINPLVVIFEEHFDIMTVIMDYLKLAVQTKRPLLIVGVCFEPRLHATLVYNKIYGGMKVCAIDASSFGRDRNSLMHDLAVVTGSQVITKFSGYKCAEDHLRDEIFGSCRKVVVTENNTIVYKGHGRRVLVEKRCAQIKSAIEMSMSNGEKKKFQERLGRLCTAICHLEVGPSETKYDRALVSEGIAIGKEFMSLNAPHDSANLSLGVTKGSYHTMASNPKCADSYEFNDSEEVFRNDDGYGDISNQVGAFVWKVDDDGPPYNPCEPCAAGGGIYSQWELCNLDCDFTDEGWEHGLYKKEPVWSDYVNASWSDDEAEDVWRCGSSSKIKM